MKLQRYRMFDNGDYQAHDKGGWVDADDAIEQLERAMKLLNAVTCGEFSGIQTNDVDGVNWWDARNEFNKSLI